MSDVLIAASDASTPIHLVSEAGTEAFLARAPAFVRAFAEMQEFKGKSGQMVAAPTPEGRLDRVLAGLGGANDALALRALPAKLPAGDYRLVGPLPDGIDPGQAALAWGLGAYRFDRYRANRGGDRPRLVVPGGASLSKVTAITHACALACDMINTPANDMGPLQVETIAREVAAQFGAAIDVVTGEALLEQNYPMIHAVGRSGGTDRQPRLIEMTWGDADHPTVAIVGKGIVFDTGGLDIKPVSGMRNMKKDMGGAAHALALGRMVMALGLKVRLVVLLPVAENAISADAMRPGDIFTSRQGLTIEVGNTDAEGRLVLADALTRAGELKPDLTIDMATLTGAARVALGPQVIPFYTADDSLAGEIMTASQKVADPLWRMPLWAPYGEAVDGDIADLKNDPDAWAQAGSITAALFLQKFAPKSGAWAHLDIFAWNPRAKPGWPAGADAQAIRALITLLETRYG